MADVRNPLADLRTLWRLVRGRSPGQVVMQLTDRCNAQCPQCGMRASASFPRSSLSTDDARRIIDHAAAHGVNALSFTGGEPFLMFSTLVELIDYAAEAGISYTRTGTNGFSFARPCQRGWTRRVARVAERLAATRLRNLWISLDSAEPDVHERQRGLPGVFRGIEKALPMLHERGVYPSANLGITRHLGGDTLMCLEGEGPHSDAERARFREAARKALRRFLSRVVDMGFTMASVCYPMSCDPASEDDSAAVYAATSSDPVVRFGREERELLFEALLATVPEFRGRIRLFTPLSSLDALRRQHATGEPPRHACRGGVDYFFVRARDATAYPCGYRGDEGLGKFWDLDLARPPAVASCSACDWECFRDPSTLFGSLAEAFSGPVAIARTLASVRRRQPLWLQDLRYYQACDLFDGRRPLSYRKLAPFDKAPERTPDDETAPRAVSPWARILPPQRPAPAQFR